jgi:uncharacterized membrane protein SirB2
MLAPAVAAMLASHYADIRLLHISCVALSGTLFTCRGLLRLFDSPLANTGALRWSSYLIDTVLLGAAILLTLILHQYPLVNGWLTMKTGLLVLYIALGVVALKRARTRLGRVGALIAALLTYCSIIGVAVTHRPSGWFSLLHP